MAASSWQRTWGLFHQALEQPEAEQAAFLDEACQGDAELRQEVERLLAGHRQAPTYLDQPEQLLSAADPAMDLEGTQIGPYHLERLIGEGGMGLVYRARQEEPIRRNVALKLVQLGMATREVLARFESERQALALLDHPHIAKVLDAGATEAGQPYFVMELVQGQAITSFCNQLRLSVRQRVALFAQVCRAVHHAHQKGIIHRDLKPSNVLVTEQDGKPLPKIIDFGLARAIDPQERQGRTLTQLGRIVGTPEYMSPEQATMASDVDIRSDVYSLGVMLYELLVGRLPHAAASRQGDVDSWRRALRDSEPPTPSTRLSNLGAEAGEVARQRDTQPALLRQQLRGDLDWIVLRALEPERSRRYGTATELAQDLDRYLRVEPVSAGPPELSYRWGKFVKRNRLAVSAAAAALLLLLIFSALTTWQSLRLQRALDQSRQEARKAEEVSSFLTGLFNFSAPDQMRSQSLSVLEILDRGARRLSVELSDQPEVQAAMLGTVGEIYNKLGMFTESEELLQRSLEVLRQIGASDEELSPAVSRIAVLRQWQGDYRQAEALARQALALSQAEGSTDAALVAQSLKTLGAMLNFGGKYDESEQVLNRALDLWRSVRPLDSARLAEAMNVQAMNYRALGRFEEAVTAFAETIDTASQIFPADHPDLATYKNNMAGALSDLSRDDEAEALLRETLATRIRIYGREHQIVTGNMNNLARIVQRRGNYEEAEQLQRSVLDIRQRIQGEEHIDVAISMLNLGVILRQTGRYEEAEGLYRQALAMEQRLLGPDHPTVAIPHHNLASLLRRQGRLEEAEEQMSRAVEILAGNLGEDHPNVARSQASLAKIILSAGRADEAEQILLAAEPVLSSKLPKGHWRTAQAHLYLGQTLVQQDRIEEAEDWLLRALAALRAARGEEAEITQEALRSLVHLYEKWQQPQEAERYRSQLPALGATAS